MGYFDEDTVFQFNNEENEGSLDQTDDFDFSNERDERNDRDGFDGGNNRNQNYQQNNYNQGQANQPPQGNQSNDVKAKRKRMYMGTGMIIAIFVVVMGVLIATGKAFIKTGDSAKQVQTTTQKSQVSTQKQTQKSVETTTQKQTQQASEKTSSTTTVVQESGLRKVSDAVTGSENSIEVTIQGVQLYQESSVSVVQHLVTLSYSLNNQTYNIGYFVSEPTASKLVVGQKAVMSYKFTSGSELPVITGLQLK